MQAISECSRRLLCGISRAVHGNVGFYLGVESCINLTLCFPSSDASDFLPVLTEVVSEVGRASSNETRFGRRGSQASPSIFPNREQRDWKTIHDRLWCNMDGMTWRIKLRTLSTVTYHRRLTGALAGHICSGMGGRTESSTQDSDIGLETRETHPDVDERPRTNSVGTHPFAAPVLSDL